MGGGARGGGGGGRVGARAGGGGQAARPGAGQRLRFAFRDRVHRSPFGPGSGVRAAVRVQGPDRSS
eukprot:3955587-Prymnesium_polylepis.1